MSAHKDAAWTARLEISLDFVSCPGGGHALSFRIRDVIRRAYEAGELGIADEAPLVGMRVLHKGVFPAAIASLDAPDTTITPNAGSSA